MWEDRHSSAPALTPLLLELQCNDTIEHALSASDVDLSGVRVGIPHEYFVNELPDEILSVWDKGVEWLRAAGAFARAHRYALAVCL